MKTLAQQAYETWVAAAVVDVYADFEAAVYHGYHTWDKLPEKTKKAWEKTVEFILSKELVLDKKVKAHDATI